MTSQEGAPLLPIVEELDLLELVSEEVADPDHIRWWKRFAEENPVLAREIIKRAYFSSIELDSSEKPPSTQEIQKIIVDAVTFAMNALQTAVQRSREAAEQPLPATSAESKEEKRPSDDADDADPQPSV